MTNLTKWTKVERFQQPIAWVRGDRNRTAHVEIIVDGDIARMEICSDPLGNSIEVYEMNARVGMKLIKATATFRLNRYLAR